MKYVACCSGGKDSVATVILAHIHGEPIDEVIFSEVMFDENISGELPEHMDFIHNILKPTFESWGYKFTILHSKRTYIASFERYPIRGRWAGTGKKAGFPMAMRCAINRDCKVKPIKDYLSKNDCIEYIGIAIDEPKRLERLNEKKVSLLEKYGYTEEMAKALCVQYGLLSPVYEFTKRGGCWFCPNCKDGELRHLFENHRNLMEKLVELESRENLISHCWNTLTKKRITDIRDKFLAEIEE